MNAISYVAVLFVLSAFLAPVPAINEGLIVEKTIVESTVPCRIDTGGYAYQRVNARRYDYVFVVVGENEEGELKRVNVDVSRDKYSYYAVGDTYIINP